MGVFRFWLEAQAGRARGSVRLSVTGGPVRVSVTDAVPRIGPGKGANRLEAQSGLQRRGKPRLAPQARPAPGVEAEAVG